jgi:hypothetical protein
MKFKDYYKILGITPTANVEEITLAYRRLARKFHPDVSTELEAEQKFKEIHDAYQVLKDLKTRTLYNDTVKIIRPYRYAWFRAKIKAWLDRQAQTQAKTYATLRANGTVVENQNFSFMTITIGLVMILAITSMTVIPHSWYQPIVDSTSNSLPNSKQSLAQLSQQYNDCLTQSEVTLHERTACIAQTRQAIAQIDSQYYLLQDPYLPTLYTEAIQEAMNGSQYASARQLLIDWQTLLPDYDYQRDQWWQTLLKNQQANKIVTELTQQPPFNLTQALGQLNLLETTLGHELLQKPLLKKALLNYYLNQVVAMMQTAENNDQADQDSLVFISKENHLPSKATLPFVLSSELKLSDELFTHSILSLPVVESVNETAILLQQCQEYAQTGDLSGGKPDAVTCYQQVLRRDPRNQEAVAGLEKLEQQLQDELQLALQQRELVKAKNLLAHLAVVNPNSSWLSHFQKQLTTLETAHTLQNTVDVLLKQCKEFHQANLLTTGKHSALACYREVLKQQPQNAAAWSGLQTLEQTFQVWAENALQNGNLDRARNYVATLAKINPHSAALQPLQQRLTQKTPKIVESPPPVVKSPPVKPAKTVKGVTKPPKAKPMVPKKKKTSSSQSVCKECNCGDILRQLSMGVKPLTAKQKTFFQTRCR